MSKSLKILLDEIRNCTECEASLPLGPRPILAASTKSRIAVIGQAPGKRVHESGVPWDDPSGDRLREWLKLSREEFYDETLLALIPMGFCYPGTGKSGDLPPRKECQELWHEKLFTKLKGLKLTLLIGQYAQAAYLEGIGKKNLTETVKSWKEYQPQVFPLPHPSPRNNIWLKKNPWFERNLLPQLQKVVKRIKA